MQETRDEKQEMKPTPHNVAEELNCRNNFPSKLYTMLKTLESEQCNDIVCWQPHGKAFHVINMNKFEKVALPRFFRHSKMSSFQRQLNIYNFHRILSGRDQNSYYHRYFVRDQPELLCKILREATKGNGVRRPDAHGDPPNFYDNSTGAVEQPFASTHESGRTPVDNIIPHQPNIQNQDSSRNDQVLQILSGSNTDMFLNTGGSYRGYGLQQQQQQLNTLLETVAQYMLNNSTENYVQPVLPLQPQQQQRHETGNNSDILLRTGSSYNHSNMQQQQLISLLASTLQNLNSINNASANFVQPMTSFQPQYIDIIRAIASSSTLNMNSSGYPDQPNILPSNIRLQELLQMSNVASSLNSVMDVVNQPQHFSLMRNAVDNRVGYGAGPQQFNPEQSATNVGGNVNDRTRAILGLLLQQAAAENQQPVHTTNVATTSSNTNSSTIDNQLLHYLANALSQNIAPGNNH